MAAPSKPIPNAQLVDLSLPLEDDRAWAPWWARTKVRYQNHDFGRKVIRWLFGVRERLLETGLGWANETIELSTHGTTHVDAPWHYGPECAGAPARTIDEIPLEWFTGPGVMLDVTDARGNQVLIDAERIERALHEIDYALRPGDIVLLHTGNDRLWGTREYFESGPTVTAEATELLIDRGIRLMGIDAWGWDGPLGSQAQRARQAQRPGIFWAAHYVGTRKEYCHLERLTNLKQLPPKGFQVFAFPLKVKRGSAGPCRVVAMLDS